MRNPFKKAVWSPYTVGIIIGILSWITFSTMFKGIGITTAFVRISGFIISIFATDYILDIPYLANYLEFKPVFEWQTALVFCIFIGSWLSATLSGVTISEIPYLWGQNWGYSKKRRAIGAYIGGFLLLFGARLAGGCTLGNGITGGLQLATASWVFIAVVFTTASITAHILYRKK